MKKAKEMRERKKAELENLGKAKGNEPMKPTVM